MPSSRRDLSELTPGAAPMDSRIAGLNAETRRLIGQFDHVTLLPNRLQLVAAIEGLPSDGAPQLLVLVTLAEARHYNEILRALGHAFTEQLVRVAARRLQETLPPDTELFHVSVLSFAFVVDLPAGGSVPLVVVEIAKRFADPIRIDDIPINVHVGIGLLPLDGSKGPAEALRAALAAGQDSRRTDEGWAWYDHQSDAAHIRAFRMLADLPAAIRANDQLSLHLQPRSVLATGRCTGAEALLRWSHPALGAIPPGEFIGLVEQTALIGPLTNWVLNGAMQHAAQFKARGRPLRISINASPANLSERGFDERVLLMCGQHGLEPEDIEIEFTEGALAANFERAVIQLERLRDAGVEVAIDDFGAGFSNLSYLTSIPADVLKIDQSFIRPLGARASDTFLVRQIIETARGLGFKACAEGIEDQATLDMLRELGCEEGQGYFIARPMPAEALVDWLDGI
jgi:EAL domain-containing protein (putative c-di-GMP-specific phosphodiesterase class I)/GGDEF domain-containing protein